MASVFHCVRCGKPATNKRGRHLCSACHRRERSMEVDALGFLRRVHDLPENHFLERQVRHEHGYTVEAYGVLPDHNRFLVASPFIVRSKLEENSFCAVLRWRIWRGPRARDVSTTIEYVHEASWCDLEELHQYLQKELGRRLKPGRPLDHLASDPYVREIVTQANTLKAKYGRRMRWSQIARRFEIDERTLRRWRHAVGDT